MNSIFITIAGIVLAFLATLANSNGLAAIAAAISLIGVYMQYKDALAFERTFSEQEWLGADRDFKISFHHKNHKKTTPTSKVFMGTNPCEEVNCDISVGSDNSVIIGATKPFAGKIVIK
jgi:hypothetical protein